MQFTKSLAVAMLAPLLATACASRSVKETPPAEALIRCPDVPPLKDDKADTLAIWAGDLLDLYNDCAAKHDALRRWHNRK